MLVRKTAFVHYGKWETNMVSQNSIEALASSVFEHLPAKPVPELGEFVIAHRSDAEKAAGGSDEINRCCEV